MKLVKTTRISSLRYHEINRMQYSIRFNIDHCYISNSDYDGSSWVTVRIDTSHSCPCCGNWIEHECYLDFNIMPRGFGTSWMRQIRRGLTGTTRCYKYVK